MMMLDYKGERGGGGGQETGKKRLQKLICIFST